MSLVEQLHALGGFYGVILLVLGLLVGSFLNVVILRLPKKMQYEWATQCQELLASEPLNTSPTAQDSPAPESTPASPPGIVFPASHCPSCKTPLKWWHNLPIFSYLALRGKCFACQQRISLRYPSIELLCGLLTVLVGLQFPQTAILPWVLVLTWSLITLSFIDIDHQLLPDNITLPLLWLGLLFNTTAAGFVSAQSAIIGAIAGYLILWMVYQAHHALTKKQGMGYGDFKLLAAAGAWLGWPQLPMVLLLSAGSGVVINLALMAIKGRAGDRQIPFGPYLAVAFFLMLMWGEPLQGFYLNLIGVGR